MSENPYAAPTTDVSAPTIYAGTSMNSPYGGYRDLKNFHVMILLLLGLKILTEIGEIYAAEMMNRGLVILDEGGDFEETINQAGTLSQSFNGLGILIFILTVIFWGIWKNKSCKNGWFFYSHGAIPNHFADNPTPGWSVGYYFVPFLNLWKPLQAMGFIRDQCSESVKTGPLLGLWWTAWLIMNFFSRYAARMRDEFETTSEATAYNNTLMVDSLITIVAAFFAAAVIHQLSVGQRRKAKAIGAIL
jgi:hypothetical protein